MLQLYIKLVFAHFVADFGLQSEWLCREKYKNPYFLIAHGFINGALVWFVTGSILLGITETFLHSLIDHFKIRGELDMYEDQAWHLIYKVFYLWI